LSKHTENILVLAVGTIVVAVGVIAVAVGLVSGSGIGIDLRTPVVRTGITRSPLTTPPTELVQMRHTPLPTVTRRPTLTPPGVSAPSDRGTLPSPTVIVIMPAGITPPVTVDTVTPMLTATAVQPPERTPTVLPVEASPTPPPNVPAPYPPPATGSTETPVPTPTAVPQSYPAPGE